MKAKTRAEEEAEGEVRGNAQMVSCQWPAVRVCTFTVCVYVRKSVYVCVQGSYHAYACMLHACMWSVSLPLLSYVHPCVCLCVPCELRRGTVCAQSCSSQMALANRHCKAGRVGTTTRCTVGTASHHALPYVPGTCCQLPKLID